MLETIKTALSSYKIYLYIALIAAMSAFWAVDRHAQYEKGKADCQTEQLKADIKKAPPAIEKADEARKEIADIQSAKQTDLVTIHEASNKASHPDSCALNDNELFILNSKIQRINGTTSSNGKLSKTGANSTAPKGHTRATKRMGK